MKKFPQPRISVQDILGNAETRVGHESGRREKSSRWGGEENLTQATKTISNADLLTTVTRAGKQEEGWRALIFHKGHSWAHVNTRDPLGISLERIFANALNL